MCARTKASKRKGSYSNRPGDGAAGSAERIAVLVLVLVSVQVSAAPLIPDVAAPPKEAGRLMALRLNGLDRGDAVFVVIGDMIYARERLFEKYRLQHHDASLVQRGGDTYRALSSIPGATWHVAERAARLELSVPARSIGTGNDIDFLRSQEPATASANHGAFVDYDLFAFGPSLTDALSSSIQSSLFGPLGTFDNAVVYRDSGFRDGAIRLESAFRRDYPSQGTTLAVGDTVSTVDGFGDAYRFAGIQYGRNFATQPYLLTFPQPTLRGRTRLPSTVDVYIDNVLTGSQDVPAGEFTTQALPVTTGQGTVRLQIRDALGRQSTVSAPFFITDDLLKPGLDDYAASLGLLRRNYAIESNDYGRLLARGSWRRGLSTDITAGTAFAGGPTSQNVSASVTTRTFNTAVAAFALGASNDRDGAGARARIALDQSTRRLSYGFSIEQTSPGYAFVSGGGADRIAVPRRTIIANAGLSLGEQGHISSNVIRRTFESQSRLDIANVSYSRNFGPAFVSLGLFRSASGDEASYSAQALVAIPLGDRNSVTLQADRQSEGTSAQAELRRNLPVGRGFGYRLRSGAGPNTQHLADVSASTAYGSYQLGAQRFDSRQSYRAQARGSLAVIDGGFFASRRLGNGFTLVDVGDFRNVEVFRQNLSVGRTDEAGKLLVPRLLPYQHNPIRLAASDLPLDADIEVLEKDAVPYFNAGNVTRFNITRANGATVTVVDEDDVPLPPGTVITATGDAAADFIVGFDGFTYLKNLQPGVNRYTAKTPTGLCALDVVYNRPDALQPDLGRVACRTPVSGP